MAAELSAFLSRLPTSTQLDALYPSLHSVRRLRLPWRALLEHLSALPLRPCRWRDEHGQSQLLLLLGARGHLLHFSVGAEKGAPLQMRACSMHRLTHRYAHTHSPHAAPQLVLIHPLPAGTPARAPERPG